MKNILHISKYYYPFSGGTEQTARDCVLALKGRYKQEVIAFNDGKETKRNRIDGIDVWKCGTFAKIFSQSLSVSYGKLLRGCLRRFQPDVIIFHYPNPFVAALLLGALKEYDVERVREERPRAKLILYWHLDIIRQKHLRKLFDRQNWELLARADRVIATSPNYIAGSPWLKAAGEKCVVIPSCINENRMNLTPEIEARAEEIRRKNEGKTICVAVGRHTEYKGFRYLIQASGLLDDSFRFYITGTGELTETLHKEAAGDAKIVFTGRVDDVELKSLIKAADIFCFPSITKNEAFGLALAEAMYYGKPVVTFHIPGSGVNYVCIGGETGIEVENRNVKAYAKALKKLAARKDLRERYGMAGQKRVMENFLSSQYKENIKQLIDDCAGGN